MPRKGFIDGPKTTITIQIPLYLARLIKKFCGNYSQTQFAVEAFCDKLGISIEEVMRKNREAWNNGLKKEA
jgi:hypothetical protein